MSVFSERRSRAMEARQGLLRLIVVVVLIAMMIPWRLALAQDEEANPHEETLATDEEAAAAAPQETICGQWHDAPEGQAFEPTEIDLQLGGHVGSSMGGQLFDTLQWVLTEHRSLKTINVLLSSNGGDPEWGFRIHNYLQGLHKLHGIQVVTHNTYSVASAAIDIFCAGNQRIASPFSQFMVHDVTLTLNEGDYDLQTIRDHEEMTRVDSEASYALVSACTNLPVADVEKMFAEETYFGTDRALEIGMAQSVIPATFNRDAAIVCKIEGIEEEQDE